MNASSEDVKPFEAFRQTNSFGSQVMAFEMNNYRGQAKSRTLGDQANRENKKITQLTGNSAETARGVEHSTADMQYFNPFNINDFISCACLKRCGNYRKISRLY